jgi:hypothetical protein
MQTSGFTSQAKLELLHDTRQAFGRTTLLLQGGSAFGLCHLGVVKALHLQGLLPRIITGTATGAMIAALVGIHPESELLALLEGDTIDLSAFDQRRKDHAEESWVRTFVRRMKRLLQKGHLYDMELLEECVRANVGDLTFEEAYARSKRILNITIATAGKTGTPNLLNYLTTPNVVCSLLSWDLSYFVCTMKPLSNIFKKADLVRRGRFQRLIRLNTLLTRHNLLQRRNRLNSSLATHKGSHLPTLAPRHLQRWRITPLPNRRTLQRKPLHRLPSPPLPNPLPTLRTQSPRPPPNRLEQPHPLSHAFRPS